MDSSISTIDINIEDLQSKPNELNASIISNDIVDMNDQLNDIINNQDTNSLLPAHETNCIINNEIDKQSSSNSKVYDMDQECRTLEIFINETMIKMHKMAQDRSDLFLKLEQVQLVNPLEIKKIIPEKKDIIVDVQPMRYAQPPLIILSSIPKKKKTPIDPNAPKKPANAFMIFSSIERDVVIAEKNERKLNGTSTEEDFGLGNLTKELGVRWRNLRPEEKQGYQDLHVQQMEVYKIKLEEYHAGLKATTQAIENTTSDQELATDLMSDLFNGEISIDEMDIDAV